MTGSSESESVITFPVAGIYGAGRLASRLNQLESVDLIGPWHAGYWIDHTHRVIRIRFSNRADARTALINVGFAQDLPPGAPKGSYVRMSQLTARACHLTKHPLSKGMLMVAR